MLTNGLILVGAGGHARVVYDAWKVHYIRRRIVVFDEDPCLADSSFFDLRVTYAWPSTPQNSWHFHIAIGDNAVRRRLSDTAETLGSVAETVKHPGAHVSSHALLAGGCFVAAGAVVAPLAKLGKGCIVNHGANVDHDCLVGDFCHIGPGACLCGGVQVGDDVFVGAGAVVLPGLRIGSGVTVGAGAVVVHDIEAARVVKGVPAT